MQNLTTFIRPSRKQAYEIAQAVYDGETLTLEQADLLLNYFTPPLPKIAKDSFAWVAKACGNPRKAIHIHKFLCVVHVISGVATASDGQRIHWAASDLPDGQYDPVTGMLQESIPSVPCLDRVKGKPGRGREICFHDHPGAERTTADTSPIVTCEGVPFNAWYVLSGLNRKTLVGTVFLEDNLITGESSFGTFSVIAEARKR